MLPVHSGLRFYLYRYPTDMRKSFDGLCAIIHTQLRADALSPTFGTGQAGDVYVFLNRRRDRIKLLVWDRNGFWIFYKRLEKGTFQLPRIANSQACLELPYEELMLILEGIDLTHIRRRQRYFVQKALGRSS
jgi:transposase